MLQTNWSSGVLSVLYYHGFPSMKLLFLYSAIALCMAQPHQSRSRTVEEVVWRLRNKNSEGDLGETKFVLRGYEGERGSSEDSRSPHEAPLAYGEMKRFVARLARDHPDWSTREIAAELTRRYPIYTAKRALEIVSRYRRSEAVRAARGLTGDERIGHSWAGLSMSEKNEFQRRVLEMVKEEVVRNGGRNADAVTVKNNVQGKFFQETGRYIPQGRLDSMFSHARLDE